MADLQIGIFALQGDFDLHAQKLQELGYRPRLVRMPGALEGLEGLIIPGGESGAYLKLMKPIQMGQAITTFAKTRGILTTCAGTITIARKVTNPEQDSLNLLDITVERNAYGRQLDSLDTIGQSSAKQFSDVLPMTFIRAPKIIETGASIEILATYNNDPVVVRRGKIIACTFHPELTESLDIYKYWISLLS